MLCGGVLLHAQITGQGCESVRYKQLAAPRVCSGKYLAAECADTGVVKNQGFQREAPISEERARGTGEKRRQVES